jgi:hypothetical protein
MREFNVDDGRKRVICRGSATSRAGPFFVKDRTVRTLVSIGIDLL